ncbi:hypothetical protein N7470_009462 [Penicillium chermesinum]|nr:hypothetical protein N7470_009462 [Penicillium chermesinum]
MAQSRQRYRLLQTQFRQTAEENLARIEKGTLDLYLDFLPAEFEEVKTSIDRMRSHIDKEYLLPKESAIRNIDGPLSFSENMNEEYLSLQTESRNVLEGIRQLKSLCSSLQQWDFLRGSRFAEHSRRLAHHRAQFAIAAHMWRSTWMNSQLALNPLQRGQMWSITEFVQFETSNTSPLTLIESTILGDASDEHLKTITKSRNMIATTLQQNYTKRWDGPKPLGSPEMDKAWRQLDVIAPLEMVITLTWWLQTEVSYLIECIQGSFGPMFDHISADMPTKSGLSGLYKRIIDHRKALLKDALEYKYINWMRLQTEEKLHELGMPNEFQAHGFLIPPKPLSQDMTRFLNWTYQYADIANLTWIRSKALELIIRPESEVFPFMARMTRLHKSIYDERVFHVPELGSRRGRMKQAWKAKIARLQQEPTPQVEPRTAQRMVL